MKRSTTFLGLASIIAGTALATVLTAFAPAAQAADATAHLKLSPGSSTVEQGGKLSVNVNVDTGGQRVSYVVGELSFSDNLEFTGSSLSGSVMPTSIQAPAANGQTIRFELTRTHDTGYEGGNGLVAQLTFKPKSTGNATITFNQSASQVLAFEDSSNVLKGVNNGSYTISATRAAAKTTSSAAPKVSPSPAETTPSPEQLPSAEPVAEVVTPSPEVSASPSPTPKPANGFTVFVGNVRDGFEVVLPWLGWILLVVLLVLLLIDRVMRLRKKHPVTPAPRAPQPPRPPLPPTDINNPPTL